MRQSLLVLSLLATFAAAPALAQQDIDKINGSISAEAGQAYGSLETVNGSIRLATGASARSAETVNGSITLDDAATAGTLDTVNGAIRLGAGVQVSGDVDTVNGGITLGERGRIAGKAGTVNGTIRLDQAEVGNGLTTVSGDILVNEGSHVRGGIHVEKSSGWGFSWGKRRVPTVVIGPNAIVEGELYFEREVELYVHPSAKVGKTRGVTPILLERAPD